MASQTAEKNISIHFSCAWGWLVALPKKSWTRATNFANKTKKLGQDDPRRVTHSLKVGFALTLVSMFFYIQALYDSFGVAAMWAIMTVVVVMEFSVGATLGKGLNRMLATLLGGSLGVGVQQLATLSGKREQPIVIAFFLYIIGAIMTFVRFVPGVKAKYDYGLTIFILTFSLVSVSGYRDDQILLLACKRILTIIFGSLLAMIVCICICPVWIGEDLHNLIAGNMEKLGDFLEGFGDHYDFNAAEDRQPKTGKSFAEKYESVLTSKTKEETMANLAGWEPRHRMFRFRHPWQQYLKVGNLTRQCAYKIEVLDYYVRSEIQTPCELRIKVKDSCQYVGLESGKALKELSSAIKSMTRLSTTKARIANAKGAVESLHSLLGSNQWEGVNLLEIVPVAAVASLLTDVVVCVERISEAVDELASLAHFKIVPSTMTTKPLPLLGEGTMQPNLSRDKLLDSITIRESLSSLPKENGTSSVAVIVQSV